MRDMANIRKWLEAEEAKTGETIESIVVGQHDNAKYDVPVGCDENIVLSRADGLKKLDVDYDNGFGGADCFPMYAWTASWVYFIAEYDGSTCMESIPRNPVACIPGFGGSH